MAKRERNLRLQIRKMIRSGGVMHGGLIEMARKCGKSGCRCNSGEKHISLYLGLTHKRKTRMLYIPQELEEQVKEWVNRYKDIREVLEELSKIYWDKIRKRSMGKGYILNP